jgi:hypothetical protein
LSEDYVAPSRSDSEPPLPVNLSIKNAPDDLVVKLKERAAKHHRSLQGELLAISRRPCGRPTG